VNGEHSPTLLAREQWGNNQWYHGLQAHFNGIARKQAEYWRWFYQHAQNEQLTADVTADSGHRVEQLTADVTADSGHRVFQDMEVEG